MSIADTARNFNELCRVCGKYSIRMISLFGIRKKGLTLADMLAICTQSNVQRTDRLPSNVCNQCLANLEIAFDFHNLVKANEERFRQILSTHKPAIEISSIEHSIPPLNLKPVEEPDLFISCNVSVSEPHKKRKMTNGLETMTPDTKRAHQQEMHEQRKFECFICKAKLKSFIDMRQHLKNHNEATPDCHRAQQHQIIAQPFICRVCMRSFQLADILKKHLATHVEEKPHLCSTCGKGFKKMSTLRSHTIRHSGYKPIACSKCPKRFFSKADLRKHMDVHSDAKYICCLCGSTLNSKRSLDEHTRHRHRKAEEQTCDLCSMKFRTVYNLKRHLLTHTGEKPHKCMYCERAFAQSGDLNKHLRSHIGEKTYSCDVCEKSFRLQIELRKHSYEHFQNQN